MGPVLLGVSSNALPGPSFAAGPFGTGTVVMMGGASSPPTLIPVGADRTVANAVFMTSSFAAAAGTAGQDPTGPHGLTLAGPITLGGTGRSVVNNLPAPATLTLGSAQSPSTITLSSAANQPLTFQSQVGGTTVVNDVLQNNGSTAGAVVAAGGTVILNAASTYTGGTTVVGGVLRVNSVAGSGTGTGALSVTGTGAVGSGGALGGGGRITGAVTISSTTAG